MSWGNSSSIDFGNWSEPVIHKIGDVLEDSSTGKTYKQTGRILKYADVPDEKGIYLFRDIRDRENYYCGKTEHQTLRKRLTQHLTGESGKLRRGEEYKIRWITSSKPELSEAIAVIYLKPKYNDGKDWKYALKHKNAKEVLREAERLGFYSKYNQEEFCLNLIEYICE
ncbi:MAG: GIY-YIG nuclease family protein [Oscillatoria princeps RMCB-10]|jgi:predicted GIY-YIG superfamily endonuclease|nr:GIY-YIG nuclease family protein [Oscillatoria princeps RMCB-10]